MLNDLFTETSSRPLGLTRIIVGIAATLRASVIWSYLSRLSEPEIMLTPYVDWLPEPTVPIAVVVSVLWVSSAILFTIGWRVSMTGPILLGAIVFTLAIDQQMYSNHLYLMAWLVLLLTIANAGAGLNYQRKDHSVVRWPIVLLMLQASFVYGFSGLTKLNSAYLSGEVLSGVLGTGVLPFPEALRTPQFLSVLAATTVVVELFIALFLWRPRFRPTAILLGVGLHTSITLLMFGTFQLLVFSLEMLAIYPLFLATEKLVVVGDPSCAWCNRWIRGFTRLDVLRSLDLIPASEQSDELPLPGSDRSLRLTHHSHETTGFAAITRILEHLVPTLWVAPLLRLPVIRGLGDRWYRWQARRRRCPASGPPTATQECSTAS